MTGGIALDHKSALAARIANLREGVFPQLHNGYALIGRFEEPVKGEVVDDLINAVADGGSRQIDTVSDRLNITEDEAGAVLFAVAAVTGALLDIEATVEDFLQVASKFYRPEDRAAVTYVATRVVKKRPALKDRVDKYRLASKIIPSFSTLNYAVDVRLDFKEEKVSQTTPVALISITTDVHEEQILMQANEHQIDMILAELEVVKAQLLSASKLLMS